MDQWKYQPAKDLGLTTRQRLVSLQREGGLGPSALRLGWWALVRTYLGLWHRLGVQGREHLPISPPFVLAANHGSHLDALALACAMPWRVRQGIFPIAAGDTFFQTLPLAAFAAGCMNALPMWRRNCGSHALKELRQRLVEEPCAYILFPEGTRSRDGNMLPCRPGLGMMVAGTPALVVPCHIAGAFQALPPHRRWPRPQKIRVRLGPPLSFADTPNDRAGWDHVAQRVQAAIARLADASIGDDPRP